MRGERRCNDDEENETALLSLRRQGSWLIGHHGCWQMSLVQGPLTLHTSEMGRQYFRVETSTEEVLLVSRPLGEKGMRTLRLDSFLSPRSA